MNNILRNNPATLDDVWLAFTEVVENYARDNIATVDIVEVTEVKDRQVSVKPLLYNTTTAGEKIPITQADIIHNVPVMMLGASGMQINFKLSPGDRGLLLACKYDIANYKREGKEAQIASKRIFNFASSVFIPVNITSPASEIVLKNANTSINVGAGVVAISGAVNITGDLNVSGKVTAGADVVASGISLKSHTHGYNDTQPSGVPKPDKTQPPT